MTIAEKIEYSEDKTVFTLFKEGLFYKCYNADAMVFVQKIKEYKVSSKFVKSVSAEVLSLGFPVSEVEKGKLTLEFISERMGASRFKVSDNDVIFILDETAVKSNYIVWAETIKKKKPCILAKEPESSYTSIDNLESIVTIIKNFDLANSTPMQSLGFIQQLKEEVQQLERKNGTI